MKILILYNYRPSGSYNHWCNVDFYQYLNKLPNVEAKFYGINIERIFPEMKVCNFNSSYTLDKIWKLYNFDVVIVAGRNRSFYKPQEDKSWLPKDFSFYPSLKILIEPDYHKYRKLSWFKDMNFDMILHRHKTNVIRAEEDLPDMKHLWFPFSVDTSVFYPQKSNRINKVSFVGNSKSKSYYFRQKASEKLTEAQLMDFNGLQFEKDYIQVLQKYTIYLNGASLYTIDCAKAFEIIASGGILLTNQCYNGFRDLFQNCYISYKNDFSDIIEKVANLLKNTKKQKQLIKKGLKIIQKRHTHYQRCKDLLKIICNQNSLLKRIQINESLDIVYTIGNLSEDAWERFKYSYESIKLNSNYNILISEVGNTNNEERLKTFISDFKYYYQHNESFDASIAKNNAFRYLIASNLFTFLDVDILVPFNFVQEAIYYYKKYNKIFICSYYRIVSTEYITYKEIEQRLDKLGEQYVVDSGILVCDKETFEQLNGFDEEYQGWGGRDSDFNKRAYTLKKLFKNKKIILFHQYHDRNFGENKDINKLRYHHRLNQYHSNPILIPKIKGLTDNRSNNNPIEILIKNNIKVCLLKETCKDWMTTRKIKYPYHLGVSDLDKAKQLNLDNVILEKSPIKTKPIKMDNLTIQVPCPVVSYLENLYGRQIRKKLI